jgi:hypothetical protein
MLGLTVFNTLALLVIGCWVVLHIKKSVTTWDIFTEIEAQLSQLKEKIALLEPVDKVKKKKSKKFVN